MRLSQVLQSLSLEGCEAALSPHWDDSVATCPPLPDFLRPEEIATNRQYCGFGPEVESLLFATAERVAADPALKLLAWHCFRLLFEPLDYTDMPRWPALDEVLGEEAAGVFYLLVNLGMTPRVREVHARLGVAEEVTRDTCTQVKSVAENHARRTGGRLGVTVRTLYWMRHYTAGRLFRLGRMEYMLKPWRGGATVFRQRSTGEAVALAPDGLRFDRHGYVDGTGGRFDNEQGWRSEYRDTERAVSGHPFSPCGYALRQQVELQKDEWACVLKEGDLTLDMHIPAGGAMTVEVCGDSMRRAVSFFRETFPAQPVRSISCYSWIFNTQFEQIPLSSTNLVDFQHELYLFPIPASGRDGLWFIFLDDALVEGREFDFATAPRDTSLRRGVADFLAAGNLWRGGAMFYLIEDLEHFGTQHYRATARLARGVCSGRTLER